MRSVGHSIDSPSQILVDRTFLLGINSLTMNPTVLSSTAVTTAVVNMSYATIECIHVGGNRLDFSLSGGNITLCIAGELYH